VKNRRRAPTRLQPTASTDPTSDYARAVVAGDIIAGPHVRAACARHLRDLQDGHLRGLRFDLGIANRWLEFFPLALRLAGGEHEGKVFALEGWQVFVVGSLFGWIGADGFRRFRVGYIETAKGSGKSPLVAGIGLGMMLIDGEARAEVYAAATKKDQAMILFRDAVAMIRQSPALSARILFSGGRGKEWNAADPKTWSFFRPIASDDGQSGPRPHCGILDELHEHKSALVPEMLRAGTKSRRQALILAITNSGHDRHSVCWDWHEYSGKVSSGALIDDSWFGYVCALDEGDDPLRDEACWPKANPSLQGADLPGMKYLREQVTQARGMPSKEAMVLRLNFCRWTESEDLFITQDVWMRGQAEYTLEEFRGEKCWAGLDLASVRDLAALVLVFKRDGKLWTWPYLWLPDDGLARKSEEDKFPYVTYRDDGWLETTPGSGISKAFIARRIAEVAGMFDLQVIGYDRHRIEDLTPFLEAEGVDVRLEPHGQGFVGMAPAIDALETSLVNGEYMHNGNPVMTWCASNTVIKLDEAGNRKFNKARAIGRIDGIVAAAMGVRMATLDAEADLITCGIVEW